MDHLGADSLRRIETELGRRMVTEFGLDLSGLVLDMTNFATYADHRTMPTRGRGPLVQATCGPTRRHNPGCLIGASWPATGQSGTRVVSVRRRNRWRDPHPRPMGVGGNGAGEHLAGSPS
jgi:hypothetical protein